MPNTLGHIGVQGFISAGVFRKTDLKWVLLGCILPDIPWIIRRMIIGTGLSVSLYDLQLFAIVQGSLFGTIFLAIAVSTLSKNFKRAFIILVLNAILHLFLDSLQVKWGSGVHLLAPFDWKMLSFDLFWPESTASIIMTVAGVLFIAYACIKIPATSSDLIFPKGFSLVVFSIAALAYLWVPKALLSMPERADNQYIRTLKQVDERPDRFIEFERRPFFNKDGKCFIRTIADEELVIRNGDQNCAGLYSARAVFLNSNEIRVIDLHRHWNQYRDILTYAGLLFIGIYWISSLWSQYTDNQRLPPHRGASSSEHS